MAKVVENASVELPEPMVEMQLDQMFYDYARRMEAQGIPMDQYMQITGLTEEGLKSQMRETAVQNSQDHFGFGCYPEEGRHRGYRRSY